MDRKEATAIQDRNPGEDTEIIEIAEEIGEGIVAGTGATNSLEIWRKQRKVRRKGRKVAKSVGRKS